MRSRLSSWLVGMFAIVVVTCLVGVQGCNVSETQLKVIADQAGLVAAVTWISYDNPTDEVKSQVSDIVSIIQDNAKLVTEGKTYVQVLQPLIEDYVDKNVEKQHRPLCKVGASSLLSAIDLMFAMYPAALETQATALEVVDCFGNGALRGLSMAADDPVMKAVQPHLQMRASLKK